jgi:ketopantoate reductase
MIEPILVGAGRIGLALARRAETKGTPTQLLGRHDRWDVLDQPAGQPIALCVRNDDLAVVLPRIPQHRHCDLLFLQNGMLRDWLAKQGLAQASRGLLFFAVADRTCDPAPGGVSPLWGHHAQEFANWLNALDLPAAAVTAQEFADIELEKLLWNCCLGVVCQAQHCTATEAATMYASQLADLVAELAQVGRPALRAQADNEALTQRIISYSLQLGDYRAAVKEWPWRNGWFVAEAKRRNMACPLHDRLLHQAMGESAGAV